MWVYFTTVSMTSLPIAISKYFQVFLVKEEAHVPPGPRGEKAHLGGPLLGQGRAWQDFVIALAPRKTELTFLQDCAHPVPGDETLLSKADNHLSRDL